MEIGNPSPATLPEIYDLYFEMGRAEAILSLGVLVSSKTVAENFRGGANAPKFMCEASQGMRDKREPITVKPRDNGYYTIIDGNGTFTAVQHFGWRGLPVQFERPDYKVSTLDS